MLVWEKVYSMVEAGKGIADVMIETGLRKIHVMRYCASRGLLDMLVKNGGGSAKDQPKKKTSRAKAKEQQLREMVAEGKRPKQIAIELGTTRQTVYNRLRAFGITPPKKVRKKDLPRLSKKYGLPMDMVRQLQAIGATRAFTIQKNNARQRGIAWELTFIQWWDIWDESGKWDLRGKYRDNYVMGRNGDVGPYAVGNVTICTPRENVLVRMTHTTPFGRLKNSSPLCLDMAG